MALDDNGRFVFGLAVGLLGGAVTVLASL